MCKFCTQTAPHCGWKRWLFYSFFLVKSAICWYILQLILKTDRNKFFSYLSRMQRNKLHISIPFHFNLTDFSNRLSFLRHPVCNTLHMVVIFKNSSACKSKDNVSHVQCNYEGKWELIIIYISVFVWHTRCIWSTFHPKLMIICYLYIVGLLWEEYHLGKGSKFQKYKENIKKKKYSFLWW